MTREEAIAILEVSKHMATSGRMYNQAIDMAIGVLSEPNRKPDYSYEAEMVKRLKAYKQSGDLISRADAIKAIRKCKFESDMPSYWYRGMEDAQDIIKNIPSADAVHGEWEHWGSPFSDESEVIDTIVCSVCGARFIEPKDEPKGEYNYCPNCGAKMDGERKEE